MKAGHCVECGTPVIAGVFCTPCRSALHADDGCRCDICYVNAVADFIAIRVELVAFLDLRGELSASFQQ